VITLADSSGKSMVNRAKIKVVGVGGCGCNSINTLIKKGITNVELIATNTDIQSLDACQSPVKIQAGKNLTKGLGTGAKPETGQKAIEEVKDEIWKLLEGSDLVFVTAGMGKGTGTGGAPIIAEMAKSMGALVIGIVFTPFAHEGSERMRIAMEGIRNLKESVDTLIVISNQKLLTLVGDEDVRSAIEYGNEVLYNAVRGIVDIITKPGIINVDFMDVKSIMRDGGDALLGTGIARGEHRATEAAQKAISNPLVEGLSITGAKRALVNIVSGNKVSFKEVSEAINVIKERAGEGINLIYGVAYDESLNEDLMVTVIATGLESSIYQPQKTPPHSPKKITTVYDIEEGTTKSESWNKPSYMRKGIVIPNKNISQNKGVDDEGEKPTFLREVMD